LITPSEPSSIVNLTGAVKFFGRAPSLIFAMSFFFLEGKKHCRRDLQA